MNDKNSDINAAITQVQNGGLIVISDSADREYEGDLVGSAALATPDTINFMVTHARGAYIAVFAPEEVCTRLHLPSAFEDSEALNNTQFRVSVDARGSVSGSSAFERAQTVNLLGSGHAGAQDLIRPGHVVPIAAHTGGLASRMGHTEAGVELMRLAGIDPPVAVDLEIMATDGHMAREQELDELADTHGLPIVSIDQLAAHLVNTPIA
jgi:3,4-dihydroxy 2-butanone 4-phosphate synthase / GTP cyclohydrolase II